MKFQLILAFTIVSILASCSGKAIKKSISNDDLFGKTVGQVHINPYFNLKIEVPEEWTVEKGKSYKSTFGGDLIEAAWYDEEDAEYPLIKFKVEANKVNPFDRDASEINELNDTKEGMEMLFGKENVTFDPYEKVNIAGKTFVHCRITMDDEGTISYYDEYLCLSDEYFLSITYSYDYIEDRPLIEEALKKIKKWK